MELSSSNIKKILIFLERKPCTFRPQPILYFRKLLVLQKFLMFSKKKAVLMFRVTETPKKIPYISKGNLQSPKKKQSFLN